jgi:AraC-like DNA-binding protein
MKEDVQKIQREFLKAVGPNAEVMRQMMNCADGLYFYMKDAQGRIMALNRLNCELCNIKDEADAIGRTSADIFPQAFAKDYMDLDREVLKSGKPVLNRITEYPADKSFRLMESNVWPLKNARGRVIGTARAYRVISAAESKTDRYGRMREVAAFITENYATKLQLADLAAMAGMSESRFKHVFARTFAATPGRYINTIRLNAARRLLEETDDLLSDIATATGFFDQSHMTRAFKAMRDLTPGEYRRRHRTQTEA